MISASAKQLLKNCVTHTEAHNKHVEEREMWKEWEKERSRSNEPINKVLVLKVS